MAIALLIDFPGMSREQYEAVMQELELRNQPVPGMMLHVAGPNDGGWQAVEVWEAEEAWHTFFNQKYEAAVKRHIQTFHATPFPVHNAITR